MIGYGRFEACHKIQPVCMACFDVQKMDEGVTYWETKKRAYEELEKRENSSGDQSTGLGGGSLEIQETIKTGHRNNILNY